MGKVAGVDHGLEGQSERSQGRPWPGGPKGRVAIVGSNLEGWKVRS